MNIINNQSLFLQINNKFNEINTIYYIKKKKKTESVKDAICLKFYNKLGSLSYI